MNLKIKNFRKLSHNKQIILLVILVLILFCVSTLFYKYIYQQQYNKTYDQIELKRPFLHIHNDKGKKTNIAFITHPFTRKECIDEYNEAKKAGYHFLGCSSYIDFPGKMNKDGTRKIENPHDPLYDPKYFSWKYDYFKLTEGWTHCFRQPDQYIPQNVPKLLLSESDFVNTQNLKQGEENKKEYDFIYVCLKDNDKCKDGWQSHNRNWDLAKKCLNVMCNKFYLKGLLIGRINCELPSGCHNLMQTTDFMDYSKFIDQYHRSRFIFCPNLYDASPRILAEALCRNLPCLVNYNIVGGWKYVNSETGEFFNDEKDFETALEKLLNNFDKYQPKQYFLTHHGKQNEGKKLLEFIKENIEKPNFNSDDTQFLVPAV